jgi:hypothetical protein
MNYDEALQDLKEAADDRERDAGHLPWPKP